MKLCYQAYGPTNVHPSKWRKAGRKPLLLRVEGGEDVYLIVAPVFERRGHQSQALLANAVSGVGSKPPGTVRMATGHGP